MNPTRQDKRREAGGRGPSRWPWAVATAALVLAIVALILLGGWDAISGAARGDTDEDSPGWHEPIRPEVARVGAAGVRVKVKGDRGITRNHHDAERADRMAACLEAGIAESKELNEGEASLPPSANTTFARNVRADQVWVEMIRIYNGCLTELDASDGDEPPARR
jgi:hypothetical protein